MGNNPHYYILGDIMIIDEELFNNECAITLLKPIISNKEEKKFRDWIKKFNPFYFIFVGGEEALIGW